MVECLRGARTRSTRSGMVDALLERTDSVEQRWDRVAAARYECLAALKQHLHIVIGDGKYGNDRFFGPLRDSECAQLAQMHCDRVLYGRPEPQSESEQGPGRLERPTLEQSIRWHKQILQWTLPEFQTNDTADRWPTLVTLAQWQLYLVRDCVSDQSLPWQPPQDNLTPRRVQQGLWELFLEVGTPAAAPKTRGNSPGWPAGKP